MDTTLFSTNGSNQIKSDSSEKSNASHSQRSVSLWFEEFDFQLRNTLARQF